MKIPRLFKKKTNIGRVRLRVVEELEGVHLRSKTFLPAMPEFADYDTICTMMVKMGFKPAEKRKGDIK